MDIEKTKLESGYDDDLSYLNIIYSSLSSNLSPPVRNEKRDNRQCLLDTPRRVTVNNKRLVSKCKKSEKKYAYMYLQKPWHY